MRPARIAVAAALLVGAAACADTTDPMPPPAVGGRGTKVEPTYTDFELPGPNLYFFCDGSYGVYVTEGSNNDSGKSAAPFVVAAHDACGATP